MPSHLLRLLLTAGLLAISLLTSPAAAQTASLPLEAGSRVGLIPLDSRPVNASLPRDAGAAGGLDVLVPPLDLLGDARSGADNAALYRWLAQADPPALIVSLDALAYGGLVQSRQAGPGLEQAWERLQGLRAWHERTGRMVLGFLTIARHPGAQDRARNLALARRALEWARDGVLARLTISWDDAGLPGSPAVAEGRLLRAEADAMGLQGSVTVGPGADEAATGLLAAYRLSLEGLRPRVSVIFSDPASTGLANRYDGVSLEQSVRHQATAAGLEISDINPQLRLFVYNGGPARLAALDLLFLARLGPVALADVARVNVASVPLARDLLGSGGFVSLYGYAAWGTPGNNLGSALAQAAVRLAGGPSPAGSALLARSFVNDYLYSTIVRPGVRAAWPEQGLSSIEATSDLLGRLRAALRASPALARQVVVEDAGFPWDRSFEVRLSLAPREPDCRHQHCAAP